MSTLIRVLEVRTCFGEKDQRKVSLVGSSRVSKVSGLHWGTDKNIYVKITVSKYG